jgi:23S rRNA (adenine2503-C2)-methyltransferase
MKNFELVYKHELPSGNVYVSYNKEKNFYIETTSMQDVDTKNKSQEILTTLNKDIIKKHLVPIKDKWLIAISTQFGCPQKCKFCLVPTLPFKGNLTRDDMWEQLEFVFSQHPEVTECDKVKVGFARMGEPQYNWKNILQVMRDMKTYREGFRFLPCYNTILPKVNVFGKSPVEVLSEEVMSVKEYLDGFLHIQISTNSTNEEQRKELFGGADVVTIEEMKKEFNDIPNNNRLITLNFICGSEWELDPNKLEGLNPSVFCVKLTPLNVNPATEKNNLEDAIKWNWDNMFKIKERLSAFGLKTIIDVAAMCELDLCCGNLVQQRFVKSL